MIETSGYNSKGYIYNNFTAINVKLKNYLKHTPSCRDSLIKYLCQKSTTSQIIFLNKMKDLIDLSKLNPDFNLLYQKISLISSEFVKLITEEIRKSYDMDRMFVSNKIIPRSHPVRRRIFNKIKKEFNIEVRPESFKKNRSSNLHSDELLKILKEVSE